MTDAVTAGYDAVYTAWSSSPTFHELWAHHAVEGQSPQGFEHISFQTVAGLNRMVTELNVRGGDRLVDLACGAGGPGLWVAQQSGAVLLGVDLSEVGVHLAAERALVRGIEGSRFIVGTASAIALADACAAGAMSIDSLQYVPDKRAAVEEIARVLAPGGRFVFTAFELDADRVAGLPVLGVDPVADYSTLLLRAGFQVDVYEETLGWAERLRAAYSAVTAARTTLRQEMGGDAMDALELEMSLTLEIEPYRRRVFVSARR